MSTETTTTAPKPEIAGDPNGFADLSHVRVRRWFCIYALIILVAVISLTIIPSHYHLLVYCFMLLTIFTTFIPGNVTYVVFIQVNRDAFINAVPAGIARHIGKVIDSSSWGQMAPWPVALIGALGSTVANVNDYHGLTLVFRAKKVRKFGNTAFYHFAKKWFEKTPFMLLLVCEFLPLPVAVLRWMAVTQAYSRRKLALACFLGRLPRYLILTGIAKWLNLNWWQTLVFCVAIATIPVIIMHIKGRRSQPQPVTIEDGEVQ